MEIQDLDLEEVMNDVTRLVVNTWRDPIMQYLISKGVSVREASWAANIIHGHLSDGGAEDAIGESLNIGLSGHMGDELRKVGHYKR